MDREGIEWGGDLETGVIVKRGWGKNGKRLEREKFGRDLGESEERVAREWRERGEE